MSTNIRSQHITQQEEERLLELAQQLGFTGLDETPTLPVGQLSLIPETTAEPKQCQCVLQDLLTYGCRCGGY